MQTAAGRLFGATADVLWSTVCRSGIIHIDCYTAFRGLPSAELYTRNSSSIIAVLDTKESTP